MSRETRRLVPLRREHADAVRAFELANREYFRGFIADRGDAYFERFADRFNALLAEQSDGICAFYVLVGAGGGVLGRFNLVDLADHTAEVGYRVAQHVAGRGVATATLQEMCRIAATDHALLTLRAGCSADNLASQRVLLKSGFVPVVTADPSQVGSTRDLWFRRDLSPLTGRS